MQARLREQLVNTHVLCAQTYGSGQEPVPTMIEDKPVSLHRSVLGHVFIQTVLTGGHS